MKDMNYILLSCIRVASAYFSLIVLEILLLGKLFSGFWVLLAMFFVLFYNSNLRQTLIVPEYEPQVHNPEDIIKNDIKAIYTETPHEFIGKYFSYVKQAYPDIFQRVCLHDILFSFLFLCIFLGVSKF